MGERSTERVKTPQKPDGASPVPPQANVYALPEEDDVECDENGDPLPTPDIHPSTNLPPPNGSQSTSRTCLRG